MKSVRDDVDIYAPRLIWTSRDVFVYEFLDDPVFDRVWDMIAHPEVTFMYWEIVDVKRTLRL